MPNEIDCWITLGSTYSYLTVTRVPDVIRSSGVHVRFRPFHLLQIFKEMNYFPFPPDAPKTRYMWQDLSRRAQLYGIPLNLPVTYPASQSIVANRIALFGLREGWGYDFMRAAYRNWFVGGKETGSEPNVNASLIEIGQDPARVLPIANGAEIDAALTAETSTAKAAGIFGSPTFSVGEQLFWGDDRLEDAIRWSKHGTLAGG
jgi:2-hydroxychromene-2-carboxylate isomerase